MAQGYYWVVTCKNVGYHEGRNPFHGHRVPLGKTDAHSAHPLLLDALEIQCDDSGCGKTYSYAPEEVIRWYGDVPAFPSHPLFS